MPTYRAYPYKGFGAGLNLSDSPDIVREDQAINAMNVLFSTGGAVQQRDGYARFTVAGGAQQYDSLSPFYKADGTRHIIAGSFNRLDAIDSTGAVFDTSLAPTAQPHYFQRFGGPTAEHVYIANGTDTVRRWTGLAFETPAYTGVTPTGKFLGLSVTDNRLVVARFSGAVAGNNPSTVRFSKEGDPLTFEATHYVDLTPGDGEEIMGVATWRDQLIVFKQTKFFVFFGNSVDDEGEPDFNYRPVDTGVGLIASRAKVSAEPGVYFLDRTGVYFTTGSQPAKVSEAVDPIFRGVDSLYYQGGELNHAAVSLATMTYHDNRLWLSFPADVSVVNNRNLVFDPYEKWWTLYDMPMGPMINFHTADADELIFGYSTGPFHLGRHAEGLGYLADDVDPAVPNSGAAITALWQGGWFTYGISAVKEIREFKLAGTGLVTVSVDRDYRMTRAFSREISFTSDRVRGVSYSKPLRKAIRGEAFSVRLFNSTKDTTFRLHGMTANVRQVRPPSVVST